ncbi:MAG: MarR family transcriptional regulator, partial [Halodesulfurarchaeum sp.]|nr:MarR family transcriptional regulator [Halodesulfurarchaeum sp.]
MDRDVADKLVAIVAGAILLFGAIWSFQAAQQPTTSMNDSMMDSMMDGGMGSYGTDPTVFLLGAIFLAALIGGGYLFIRKDLLAPSSEPTVNGSAGAQTATQVSEPAPEPQDTGTEEQVNPTDTSASSETGPAEHTELLQYLPEDERRVLEPVIDSPGVTQIEVRDRSDFSKSKVSP